MKYSQNLIFEYDEFLVFKNTTYRKAMPVIRNTGTLLKNMNILFFMVT
jgi:hypothetical protein